MTLLVQDLLTGTDGTALTAHTPDVGGGTWIVVEQGATAAAPSIKSNGLKIDGGAGTYNETSVALPKSGGYGTSDYLVTGVVVYALNDTLEQFISARVDTAASAYKKYSFGWYRQGSWQLRKYTGLNGVYSVLASATAAFPSGSQTLVMRVVTVGGNTVIQCKVAGVVVINATTDSTAPVYTTGIAGVVGFNQALNFPPSGVYTDSIQVDTVPVGAQDVLLSVVPAGAIPATAFTTQPSGTIADAYGAAVTGQADTITVSKVSGPGTLSGTLTAAVNTGTGGWAFTNLQCSLAGAYVLQFTSTAGYAPSTTSFTVYAKTANFSASLLGHATSDAGMTPLDGAFLEIRDGTQPANTGVAATGTLGATITFENPGTSNWGTPYGVTVALPSASVTGAANITPTWARLYQSDHTTVLMDMTCGPAGVLVLSQATISVGQRVQLEALVLYDPGYSISIATQVSGECAIGGTMDGPAELPRVFIDTTPPTTTVTKTVGLAGRDYTDLQAAVTAASLTGAATTILVDNGYDYTPPGGAGLMLPAKAGTNWVVIRPVTMPCAPGTRVTPALAVAANLPKIRLDNGSTAVNTTSGSAYYRLQGFEVLPVVVSPPPTVYSLVNMQPDNSTPGGQGNSYSDMPHHLVVDRCYIHGNNGTTQIVRAVPMNGDTVALIESHVADVIHNTADAQSVGFWMQKGPVRVTNNYLEGTGQSILVGGAESRWPGVCVADIEIRYNTLAKNPAWNGVFHDIKTIMEMKAGKRCLIEGNDVLYNWNDPVSAWKGVTFTFKTVSQDGAATVGHWRCADVTVRNNRISYAGGGFNLHPLPESGKPATPAARFTYRNNLAAHMADYPAVPATKQAIALEIGTRYTITDLLIDHCTFDYPSRGGQGLNLGDYGSPASNGGIAGRGYVRTTIKNSIFAGGGDYPVFGRDYTYVDESLAYYVGPTSTVTRNVFSGGRTAASGVPVSAMGLLNRWLVNTTNGAYPEIGFANLAGENYALAVSSPYRAGGSFPALDGTDLGVDTVALSAALAGSVVSVPPPTPSTASTLAFTRQPSGATFGQPFSVQPVVAIKDPGQITVTTDTRQVSLQLVPVAGMGDLLGPTSATPSAGLAAFAGSGVTSPVGTFALYASAPGLTPALSLPFIIGSPAPTAMTVSSTQQNPIEALNPGVANELSDTWEVPMNDPTTRGNYKVPILHFRTQLTGGLTIGKGGGSIATNTAYGSAALGANTTGVANTGIGYQALGLNLDAAGQTAVGFGALGAAGTGNGANTAIGYQSLNVTTSGTQNVACGYWALQSNVTGSNNAACGYIAMQVNVSGNYNAALGYAALNASTSDFNTGCGGFSLYANTGTLNTSVGYFSLRFNTSGNRLTAIGCSALLNNVSGSGNVGLGYFAGAYELGSNAFYVDNQDRTNTAGDKAKALLYGTFNATAASQTLAINAGAVTILGSFGCNTKAAQGAFSLGAAATDLASVLVLANNLRTMAINNGMGS